jgi:hypothetical protein
MKKNNTPEVDLWQTGKLYRITKEGPRKDSDLDEANVLKIRTRQWAVKGQTTD